MTEVLTLAYPWLRAAHIIFVIFWMAGLFMLPRFFVYHQEAPEGSEEASRWIEREDKLATIILNPSMLIVWVLGLTLAYYLNIWSQPWFHAKLFFVIALSGYQGWLMAYRKKLARGERPLSGKRLRMLNEVPGIAVAVIVILVIVRPF
ncbi:CopD family protein [Parasphingopyxis algicola]|uniref:CopD family protein n=1 Tax=Parasphingopyxis algicola TaxID=2026624 RepID=UPI0015A00A65|nr:CopD family protein [Parasphingopyxis algicola]QLC25638.1 CopD family protein [Parasphingopyxis algicola]